MLSGAVIGTILVAIAMFVTAYSGMANPLQSSYFAILVMCFPIALILNTCTLIFWIIFRKWKIAIIPTIATLGCLGPIFTLFPMNIFHEKATDVTRKTEFKLLTYNIMNFIDFEGKKNEYNRTLQYILDVNADIVCLQECDSLRPSIKYNISIDEIDSLLSRYPNRIIGKRDVTILSKQPIKKTDIAPPVVDGCDCDAYQVIIHDTPITVVNVHLESIGLTSTDKELYYKLTSIQETDINIDQAKDQIRAVRNKLFPKLSEAFRQRARQAQAIRRFLDKIDGNVILCGDFNDIPGSYAYRLIKGNLTDAYCQTAFFPTITYHANRFYFKIDQIFYGGNIKAIDVTRGNIPSSDHYPLLATFYTKQ